MRIVPVDGADDRLLAQVVALYDQADAVDCPWQHGLTMRSLRTFVTRGWDTDPEVFVAGVEDDEVVAAGSVMMPTRENTDQAWLGAAVRPDRRGHGLGTLMYDHLEGLADGNGRTHLVTSGWDSPATVAFAEGRGYRQGLVDVARRLDMRAWSPADLDAVVREAQSHAAAYSLERVAGPLPDETLEAYLLAVAAINDAPLDDLALEDEVHDAERLRYYEATQAERGMRLYRVIARHRASGAIAGHTVLAVESDRPQYAEQHDTTVVREHRGHRIGLLLKADMMRWLHEVEPQLEYVNTQNAESNAHMVAVNERLGYVAVGRRLDFQQHTSSRGAGRPTGTA